MNLSTIYSLLLFVLKASADQGQARIIGGYSVSHHSVKYQVSLQRRGGFHYCGGSLIRRRWVLTAAHCRIRAAHMQIVVGEHSLFRREGTEQVFYPLKLISHPQYNLTTKNGDIMLIKLSRMAYLNYFVGIVALPRRAAFLTPGTSCRVSGWGLTNSKGGRLPAQLRAVRVPIVDTSWCNGSQSYSGKLTRNMICAGFWSGGKDACRGDSGGPLICQGRLYGVVSWGNNCAEIHYPGVYTAVAKFRKWIDWTIFQS
ncbi:trypsin-3-like [Callorhinchus milii]|uniref:trypsin-3-like n=1 Tax=Callorhinchus milii TaxID=7868 RepID=UPI001C3FC9D0|nr:trypsin-3-like [Callorhinchus milii]